jgi:hypothetical protein
MAAGALGSGFVHDKRSTNVLRVLLFLIALVPELALQACTFALLVVTVRRQRRRDRHSPLFSRRELGWW